MHRPLAQDLSSVPSRPGAAINEYTQYVHLILQLMSLFIVPSSWWYWTPQGISVFPTGNIVATTDCHVSKCHNSLFHIVLPIITLPVVVVGNAKKETCSVQLHNK